MTNPNAMTLAAQMAVRELKQKLRDEGKRLHEIRISEPRKAIAALLNERPDIIAKAEAMIATDPRFSKFRSGAQTKRR